MTGSREVLLTVALLGACTGGVAAQQAASTSDAQSRGTTTTPTQGRADRTRILPQGFSVVLVLADLTAANAQDDVPPAARRALADMKDFLPYKSYKLLDAAWILGQGSGNAVTRLRGVDEQEYELRLHAVSHDAGVDQGRVSVRFTLADSPGDEDVTEVVHDASGARSSAELKRELVRLQAQLEEARKAQQQAQARDLEARIADLRRRTSETRVTPRKLSFAGRAVVDTNFTMEVGETVVVGTSRLRGGSRALIALLTAVPGKGVRPEAR
jgi:hypothetical protein